MRRPLILGGNPCIPDVYIKSAKELLEATGGNTGNLAFQYAVLSHLKGPVPILSLDASASEVRAAGDIIVLPLANQLGSHTDLGDLALKLEEINLPIIGVGLGAQAASSDLDIELTSGTERWLRTIVRLRPSENPNLGVRGAYTWTQLAKLGVGDAAVVTGCPSNFLNINDRIADKIEFGFTQTPKLIAVTAGIQYIPELAAIEQNLVSLVTETGGSYIVQHDLEMIQLARNEFENMSPNALEDCRNYMMPQADMSEFKTWCRRHAIAFGDVQSWMDFLRRFDFVVGTRIHGAMLAIQAGVPAACIAHDSRTLELCETMGIPVCRSTEITELTIDNVRQYFAFDKHSFIETRRSLFSRYLSLYRSADVEINVKYWQ